jgi:type I restriction enzyme S subunit
MKVKPYPKYKQSGVEWLGEVPEHWEVKRVKYKSTTNDETLPETTPPDYEILYVDISSVDPVYGITNKEQMIFDDAPSRARRIVRAGDTIVSTVRTYLRAIAPIRSPEKNLIVSTGFAVIRPKDMHSGFLSNAIRSPYFIEEVVSRSVGVSYPAINASEIGLIPIPLPPLPEQQSIASFLDRETGRIDMLIFKKQNLIDILKEKRTSLISRAVTKGLDPNVKMKPSGVEWLGEVPDHWKINKLSRVAIISYGVGGEIDRSLECGLKTISLPNIDFEGRLNLEDVPYAEISESEKKDLLLRKGDLLFNWRNGSSEHLGKTALFNIDGEYSHVSFLLRIRFNNNKHCSNFFRYLLAGYRITGFFKHSKAGVNNTFNLSELSQLPVFYPSFDEQLQIAKFLDIELAKIDSLISKVETVISKLKENRTALISAAVTGKIDVREAV